MKKLMVFGNIGLFRQKPIRDLSYSFTRPTVGHPPWYCIFTCFKYFPVSWGNTKQTFSIHYHWFDLYRYWVSEHFLGRLQSVLPMMPSLRSRFLEWLSRKVFELFLPCFVPSMTASFLIAPMNTVLKKWFILHSGKGKLTEWSLDDNKISFAFFIFLVGLQGKSNLHINHAVLAQIVNFDIIWLLDTITNWFIVDLKCIL